MSNLPYNPHNPNRTGENLDYVANRLPIIKTDNGTEISGAVEYLGKVVLASGQAEVVLPDAGFKNFYIAILSIEGTTANAYGYVVQYVSNRKFIIKSSESTDSSTVRWLAKGY